MSKISIAAIHPGEVLREEYLLPMNLSAGALAKLVNVPRTRIERIATEQTGITPDTALRLGKVFNTTPTFWMNMQNSYDLAKSQSEIDISSIQTLDTAGA